eukprot:126779_1
MGTCCSTNSAPPASYAAVKQEEEDTVRDDPFFSIFKSSTCCCPYYKRCDAIQRIAKALKYYQSLRIHFLGQNSTSHDEQQFMEFCHVIYKALLDDYIHIITTHDDELTHVSQLIMMNLYDACDVNTCASISRHYNHGTHTNEDGHEHNHDLVFYVQIMDSIHCYLVHSYDTGLRKTKQSLKPELSTTSLDMYRRLSRKKFNIDMHHFTHHIFRDDLYTFMLQKSGMNPQQISDVWHMFTDEEYDTDAIQNDIEWTQNGSNIAHDCNTKCYDTLVRYLSINDGSYISTQSEEIGYKFFYWKAYEGSELYVTQRYDTLKEEILHNDIFTLRIDEFTQSVHKTNKYMATQKVKKAQSFVDEDPLQFGIQFGAKLSSENLLSIILWCDWMELCLSLKSTLRRDTNAFESVQSVANRNREYRNWSKLLRETIEYFGDSFCRNQSCVYCGCEARMVMPHLYLKMNSVTSCSRLKEVIQVNSDQGIVMELNDCGTWDDVIGLDSFAVNWCSKYAHENEMLFCGGNYRIKIQNIYLHNKIQSDLSMFLRSLFNFEFMISGNESEDFVTKPYVDLPTDYDILSDLMRIKTNRTPQNEYKYPHYIHHTFEHFTNSLTAMIINLDFIHRYFEKISRLLIYDDDMGLMNAPREVIWTLFPNVQHLVIYTTDATGQYDVEYPLHLVPFLHMILSKCAAHIRDDIEIVIYATHTYEWNSLPMTYTPTRQSWISDAYTDELRQQFKLRGFDIELTQINNETQIQNAKKQSGNERIKDCLRITKR